MSNNDPKAIVPGGRGKGDSDNIPNNSGGNSKSNAPQHPTRKPSIFGDYKASTDAPQPTSRDDGDE